MRIDLGTIDVRDSGKYRARIMNNRVRIQKHFDSARDARLFLLNTARRLLKENLLFIESEIRELE